MRNADHIAPGAVGVDRSQKTYSIVEWLAFFDRTSPPHTQRYTDSWMIAIIPAMLHV